MKICTNAQKTLLWYDSQMMWRIGNALKSDYFEKDVQGGQVIVIWSTM